jgi:hypothetical protein
MKNSDRYVSIVLLGLAGLWAYLTFQIKANSLPGRRDLDFFPWSLSLSWRSWRCAFDRFLQEGRGIKTGGR